MVVYSHGFFAMNTRFAMVIPGMTKNRGDELAQGAAQIVKKWEQCLSRFISGAELQVINALGSERELRVSDEMNRVLDICDHYNHLTNGLFDPAVNQNRSAWKDVIRDRNKGSVFLAGPHVILDMGGIGKGIALEDVVLYFRQKGVSDAFISFGESSIAGMGKHPHGDGWLVGTPEGFLLHDAFMSVSGLQNLRKDEGDNSGAHIYHPLKGKLINLKRRVMVKCASPVEAEVLSTCAYMADEFEFDLLKKQFPEAEWKIRSHSDTGPDLWRESPA